MKKFIEFQINHEDENGDIQDCDHRETLEEALKEFESNNYWTSIEKVTDYWEGDDLKYRFHETVRNKEVEGNEKRKSRTRNELP